MWNWVFWLYSNQNCFSCSSTFALINFRISWLISTKKARWDFVWHCAVGIDQIGKNWHLTILSLPIHNHGEHLCHLYFLFISSVACSFLHMDLAQIFSVYVVLILFFPPPPPPVLSPSSSFFFSFFSFHFKWFVSLFVCYKFQLFIAGYIGKQLTFWILTFYLRPC